MPDDAALIGLETDGGEAVALPAELANPEAPGAATEPATPAEPSAPTPPQPADPAAAATAWERERAGLLRALSEERDDKKTLRDQVNRLSGMVEAIAKPTVTAPVVEPGPTAADLEDTARSLGLYKADGSGQLDLVAAKNVLAREAQRTRAAVEQVVEERVKPLQTHVETQQAQAAVSSIFEATRGKGIEDRFTQAAIQNLTGGDPRTLMQPGVQVLVTLTAAGMKQMIAGGAPATAATAAAAASAAAAVVNAGAPAAPAAPAAPPAFVADTGARPATAPAPELSALEKKTMRSHGMKVEEFRDFTKALDKANESGRGIPASGIALED